MHYASRISHIVTIKLLFNVDGKDLCSKQWLQIKAVRLVKTVLEG